MAPTQTIALDLSRRNDHSPTVWLGKGDRNGTALQVNVTEGGRPYDCSGMTPTLVTPRCKWQGTSSGNVLTIPIDESQLGDFVGTIGAAYVSLESEDMVTSTQRFAVVVMPGVDEPSDESSDEPAGNPEVTEEP